MAVKDIEVYPTCDIHLLLRGADGSPTNYQLHVRDYLKTTKNLSGITAKTKYTDNDTSIATVSVTGEIKPIAVGETICRIRHTDRTTGANPKTFVSEILVRIRVHDELDDIWIGNNRASLFKGEKSFVLTVYAHFSDGTIGDVSSHPYLTFTSTDTSKVRVDNAVGDKGRLEGRNTTGSTAVKVQVKYQAITREVDVFVGSSMATNRRILKRIHGSGNVTKRRNILVIADGFAQAEEPLFMRMATLVKDRFFGSSLHEPYNLMKDSFNVWVAFDASGESGAGPGSPISKAGVNVGPSTSKEGQPLAAVDKAATTPGNYSLQELIVQVGFPDRYHPLPTNKAQAETAWAPIEAATSFTKAKVERDVRDEWLKMREYHLLQNKDSRFGSMNGRRYGDRESHKVDPAATPRNVMEWHLAPEPPRALMWDRRRLPKDWNTAAYFQRYLESLRLANGSRGPIDRWISGVDEDLIVFLVNTAYDSGVKSSIGVRVSTHQDTRYHKLNISGRVADHDLPELIPLRSLPYIAGTSTDTIASVLAHELGHTFNIGDEYEGGSYAGTHDVLKKTDKEVQKSIDKYLNLTHQFRIENTSAGPGTIDVKRVNWFRWMRIERASVLTQNPTPLSGSRLQIKIPSADRINWISAEVDNRDVYLRSRTINDDNPSGTVSPEEGPLKIQSLQNNGTMVLTGVGFTGFKKDDIIYLPELDGTKELTVFHPAVLTHLETKGEPFAKKADPSVANTAPSEPTGITDPTFKPRIAAFTIGVYEGGGAYNSKVYRPAGTCKMRDTDRETIQEKPVTISADPLAFTKEDATIVSGNPRPVRRFMPFCYVCKYTLANTIDPTKLEKISYPQ